MIRLDGGDPSFGDGMRIATSKLGVIAGYAFIAATVGMILRECLSLIRRILNEILSAG